MRAFIAVDLPGVFADQATGLLDALRAGVAGRFMPRENLHVTLTFLGDVGEAEAAHAVGAVERACAASGPVVLEASGLGTFGRARAARERTLFLDLAGSPGLSELASAVRAELGRGGVAYDEKPFRPHVTLVRRARFSQGALLDLPFPLLCAAQSVTLFKSTLASEGAFYKPLFSAALRQGAVEK